MTKDNCVICNGVGKNFPGDTCTFCNGTGEPSSIAEQYMRNHICQCINLDRVYCPVCKKKCHHDTSLNPKQTIDPGYGGLSSSVQHEEVVEELEEEEMVVP